MFRELKLVFIVGLVAALGAIAAALTPSYFNFTFEPRMMLDSTQGQITLDDFDFTAEPGDFHSFQELERFFERQGQISRITSKESLRVQGPSGEVVLNSKPYQIKDIPILFWVQIFVGLTVFYLAGWVWSLRRRDLPGTFFLWGGTAILCATFSSAVYTSRELGLPKNLFMTLAFLNALGGGGFGIFILNFFLVHPLKVPYWKVLAWVQSVFFSIWVALYVFRITWANVNVCILIQLLLVCLVIGFQLWQSRQNPQSRMVLTWLGISMIFGGGAFVVFNTIPALLKITPLNQGYSFIFVLFIFLGIAAGLTQFRFFKWGRWVFYFCFYMFGTVAFALLYSGFILVFKLNSGPAAILAFLLVLILYMPLGDSLWRSLHADD